MISATVIMFPLMGNSFATGRRRAVPVFT